MYRKERDERDVSPTFSVMASAYFSGCATSTASEGAFSEGRLVCHHSEKLTTLMSLNNWKTKGFYKFLTDCHKRFKNKELAEKKVSNF